MQAKNNTKTLDNQVQQVVSPIQIYHSGQRETVIEAMAADKCD
jgi:hypothetical protein